ncbi:hypothetical protein P171DRAFT_40556 [Karstenula rhodostoma CBS 690.94]|uniref:Uncharacterized protein n=1 Tax=Karstenula rhodostoma CBS 690.94 TaxID=1392251 RepID=A0A9P4UBY0_9PLEO|nr:hypothetical protein P171DRAFT_40556 [Karstenula rhodostoma CBS 690.94]
MESWSQLGRYGPLNPPPPPSGPPPQAAQQSDADEHAHRPYQRCERRPASSCPEPSSLPDYPDCPDCPDYPDYPDARPERERERGRYRERSPQRNRSRASLRESFGSGGSRLARPSPSAGHAVEGRHHSRRSSSPRWRSRSPRGSGNGDQSRAHPVHQEHDQYENSRARIEYQHPQRQRSLTPVFVRERRISSTDVPETAYPLRAYTNYIADNHAAKRRNTSYNRHLPVFRNGDGKVNPSAYGSVLQYDFGLCYCTFRTPYICEMGIRCPWRHHPLSSGEKQWIQDIAHGKGEHFIQEADKCWASPDVPVPGHNMLEVMQQERDAQRLK